MAIGSPNPPKKISQPVLIGGALTVVDGGDIRTRLAGVHTGGGRVTARHVDAGGSAGGFHILTTTGSNDLSIMPDGSPASNILFECSGDSITWGSVAIATGALTVLSLVTDIDAGVTFGDGSPNSGVALATSSEARSVSNMDFTVLGWSLLTDVAGTLRVQVFKQSYASYNNSTWVDLSGTSTGTNGMPRIALGGGIKNTSGNLSGWTVTAPTIARGDLVRAVVTNNAGANGWYALQLYGRRNVKKT